MRKRLHVLALLAVVLSVLLLPASAGAAPPVSGDGTFTVSSVLITSTRLADGNTFLSSRVTTLYSGTLQGTGVGEETVIIHPDGKLNVDSLRADQDLWIGEGFIEQPADFTKAVDLQYQQAAVQRLGPAR